MKYLIIKNEADGGFDPVCIADNLTNVLKRFADLKNKNPELQYTILKQELP